MTTPQDKEAAHVPPLVRPPVRRPAGLSPPHAKFLLTPSIALGNLWDNNRSAPPTAARLSPSPATHSPATHSPSVLLKTLIVVVYAVVNESIVVIDWRGRRWIISVAILDEICVERELPLFPTAVS